MTCHQIRAMLGIALSVVIVSLDARASDTPDDVFTKTFDQAKLALQHHQYNDAVKLFRRANEMHGNICDACLWGLASAYDGLRAFKNVAETCDQLIAIVGPSDSIHLAAAYNLKGLAIFKQSRADKDAKRLPDAIAAFRSALGADPNVTSAHYNLGYALLVIGDEKEGVAELKTYLEKDPTGKSVDNARRLIESPRRAGDNFAPDFAVTTMDGAYVSLADLRGKVVLLDFWGSWCRPCLESVGSLKKIQQRHEKEPFVLISVSVHDQEDKWRKFVADHQMTWPQYLDSSSEVAHAYGVVAFPTFFVIDPEGFLIFQKIGASETGHAENAIEDALKKMKPSASIVRPQ